MPEKIALIAGVSGAIGSALAKQLAGAPEWTVYGISRRPPTNPLDNVNYLQVDLNDVARCTEVFRALGDVSHVYYCGRATHAEQVLESAEDNLRLLRNLLDGIEAVAINLEHVHVVQGGKYYGVHLGPFPTPAQEDDFRAPIENFNYDQQDFIHERGSKADWSWSTSRPNTLLHFSPAIARNLVSTLGTYAALCRHSGAALDFPGNQGAFDSVTQVTSLDLLSRGIHWMSTNPDCADQAFNITNTDVFRWRSLWPKLAEAFEMPVGTVRPMQLTECLAGRNSVWRDICENHQLQMPQIKEVANWAYADATLERHWDEILCHNKARRFGFLDWDNSEETFFRVLRQYRDARILPS